MSYKYNPVLKQGLDNSGGGAESDPIFTAALDADDTLAANSNSKVPSQKAVKTYADTKLGLTAQAADSNKLNGQLASWYQQLIPTGTTAQYYKGNKTWATLNKAAVAGLTDTDAVTFGGLTINGTTTFNLNTLPASWGAAVQVTRSHTNLTGVSIGLGQNSTMAITGTDNPNSIYGLTFSVNTSPSSEGAYKYTGSILGFQGFAYHNSPSRLYVAYAGKLGWRLQGAGNLDTAYGIQIASGLTTGSAGTVGTSYSLYIESNMVSGAGTINNDYAIYLKALKGAVNNFAILSETGNIVFNENGDPNSDMRVEGDNDTNLLMVDASADKVGVGVASPSEKLEVNGTAKAVALKTGTSAWKLGARATSGSPLGVDPVQYLNVNVDGVDYMVALANYAA